MQKDKSQKLIAAIAATFMVILSTTFYIVTMIYGWGIHPRSWWIILAGFLGMTIVSVVTDIISKS